MQKHRGRKWAAGIVAAAMALSLAGPATAMAAGGSANVADEAANWTVPTKPMKNTVEKDGKTYKVVTTWAMAWSTSGPDFLGINNSSFYGNGKNGNADVTSSTKGSKSTMLGVWASDANEEPNAFNWNSFYNLYASEQTANGNAMPASDMACATWEWDTSAGVWAPFKYRPEIIWTSNNMSVAQAQEYSKLIHDGTYYTDGSKIDISIANNKTTLTLDKDIKAATGDAVAECYVEGDENYAPKIMQPISTNPYTFVESAYQLAGLANDVIKETATNDSKYAGQAVTTNNVNWKSMNALPRSTRYTETPDECALNIEEVARGSVYYTLSKIKSGDTKKKKVAYIAAEPGGKITEGNPPQEVKTLAELDSTHAAVVIMDYNESINGLGLLGGSASWSPLAVNQLGAADGEGELVAGRDHVVLGTGASTGTNNAIVDPKATYTFKTVTADELASCDVIFGGKNATYDVQKWRDFISTNATTSALKKKGKSMSVITGFPYVLNGSNFTMDKLVYGAYAMDVIYPELFPNMENFTFWYNKVYHVKNASLGSAMSWALGAATLPSGVTPLSASKAKSYKPAVTLAKYDAGLTYFQSNKTKDATLKRVLSNTALDGSTAAADSTAYNYANFEPSELWTQTAKGRPAVEVANTMTVKAKTVTAKAKAKTSIAAKKAFTVTNAKGKVTYTKTKGNAKIKIAAKTGVVTVAKGLKAGTTYKVKVAVKAAGKTEGTFKYKPQTKNVTLQVKVK